MIKVCDAHCDTLYSIGVNGNFDTTVTEARLREGGVAIQTFAMFAGSGEGRAPYASGRKMLEAAKGLFVPVYKGALPEELPDEPHGVISIEGGEMLEGSLERLTEFNDEARVRLIALTWNYENEIAYPAKLGPERGLKDFGRKLVARMDELGIMCDVSHLNEAGFWDVLELSKAPVVASHSNARALCDVPRDLRDEQIKAIIAHGGFIGINFYSSFLVKERPATLDDVFRHMDHILELGGERVLGFGSDFDGIDAWPEGLATPADFPAFIEKMRAHGYSQALIEDIAGRNFLRALRAAEA